MFNILKKIVHIPEQPEATLEAVELWSVRWKSRYDKYHGDTKVECEFFTSLHDANVFASALRNAFELIRHTSENRVLVEKANSPTIGVR